MRNLRKSLIYALLISVSLFSCREELGVISSTSTNVSDGQDGEIKGFFLLNEGNMGSNKATLDFYDYTTGDYNKNIYPERNPTVIKELGDVGNDIKIWGDKLYAVINCSNLVEIMDIRTAEHITQVSIPNCRYLAFKDNYAYVSSYAGAVEVDPNARKGYVARIDTLTFEVLDTCTVGYQPEQMAVVGNKLYVANSGGYMKPNYDETVSVIDLNTFKVIKEIEVGINLHGLEVDSEDKLWVSSRGDYYDVSSKTFVIDTNTDTVTDTLHLVPNSAMTICGDSLYVLSSEWSWNSETTTINYAIVNTIKKSVATRSFIKDGTESSITVPYGLAVNPYTKEIFVTDAKDYVTPGEVHCYSPDGYLKWSATTGDIPASFVFTNKELEPLE